jgi:hypothetical protein
MWMHPKAQYLFCNESLWLPLHKRNSNVFSILQIEALKTYVGMWKCFPLAYVYTIEEQTIRQKVGQIVLLLRNMWGAFCLGFYKNLSMYFDSY